VLVLTGDGSLLMSLGSLVTIVASGAKNLTLIVVDNGVYEVTGGQSTAGSIAGVDFPGFARAAGFPNVSSFRELATWNERASEILTAPGPRFVHLSVAPERIDYLLDPPCPMSEQLAGLKEHLAT
jgi:thiamine pyrophosphate-dependent acetolactate synthase large subunit-like protein